MLRAAVRGGLAAVRRAGLRGFGLALLTHLAPLPFLFLAPLATAGLIFRTDLLLGLIRLLGAHRPEPLPELPQVEESGERIGRPPHAVAPVGPDDRSARHALRMAVALLWPAIRLAGVQLLVMLTALLALVALSGGRAADLSETQQVLLVLPLMALGATFLGVAGQRIALEGDPRVLVAAAHSLRVARFAYGPLLLLNVVQPAIAGVALLVVDPDHPTAAMVAGGGALFLLSVLFQLAGTAAATEIYVAGPRLDVPADFGARPVNRD